MGLKLTLPQTDNYLYKEFVDAYWSVDGIEFVPINGETHVKFNLNTYPSRDSKMKTGQEVENTGIPYGSSYRSTYTPILHQWNGMFKASLIFPNGIPLSEAEQKQALYSFVKEYTGLPFDDVFEE